MNDEPCYVVEEMVNIAEAAEEVKKGGMHIDVFLLQLVHMQAKRLAECKYTVKNVWDNCVKWVWHNGSSVTLLYSNCRWSEKWNW